MYQETQGGAMEIFFFKLCRLLNSLIVPIFVFDGQDRPSDKRGKKQNTQRIPSWVPPCKEIIGAFGFYSHQVRTQDHRDIFF